MKHNIATIINYCTNDYRFLDLCVGQAKKFSSQIIIPVSDHFFNGIPENRELLDRSYAEHPECEFVEFHFDPNRTYGIYCPYRPQDEEWIKYWHSTSRYIGFHRVAKSVEFVLFLDVDEIVDAERFIAFLNEFSYRDYAALRFYSYFYFREPIYRAKTFSLNALFLKKEAVNAPEMLLTPSERKGAFDAVLGKKMEPLVGLDDAPLVHHYSWVRTKEELLFKVKSWGHSLEKDWTALLEEEFSQAFRGREKLYGLSYDIVPCLFDPFSEKNLSQHKTRYFTARPSVPLKIERRDLAIP